MMSMGAVNLFSIISSLGGSVLVVYLTTRNLGNEEKIKVPTTMSQMLFQHRPNLSRHLRNLSDEPVRGSVSEESLLSLVFDSLRRRWCRQTEQPLAYDCKCKISWFLWANSKAIDLFPYLSFEKLDFSSGNFCRRSTSNLFWSTVTEKQSFQRSPW